ncbi:MAG: 4Fe-4S dicluster domain-containing protein [Bacilli bacterium]|jgi:[FeFe] hydrogenase (group B1/B3)
MIKFDTNVQELKYKILKEVAKSAFNDSLMEDYNEIPKKVVPGPKPTMRCCIYKERAIVLERIKLALGGNKNIDNVIEVINIACDECPIGGYVITNRCRGCIAHRCQKACPKNAISFDAKTRSAIIDKTKCVNCGLCARACQYNAIVNAQRPCEQACKVKALSMAEDFSASIDNEKCVQCGACVYQCPFGAIMDKSSIVDVINVIKDSHHSEKYPVYAIVAPSIASQFKYATLGQIVTAIKKLGFRSVVEAALGADFVSYSEAKELSEKGFLMSSCCPTFVSYAKKNFPDLEKKISTSLSPMVVIAKYIKANHPQARIAFIGPCISKKKEIQDSSVKPFVDFVLTFEELQALIDSQDINAAELQESALDNASFYGRIFARSGGLSDSIKEAMKERGIDFSVRAVSCDGLESCYHGLSKARSSDCDFNLLEGMGCVGGCIGGPCCLTHEFKDKTEVDKYGREAKEKSIQSSIQVFSTEIESD